MQVQVFAKGYFPAQNGNTLYYRVFKGLITNVSHTDTGTALQISVTIQGMFHFLDLMHIDLAPGLMTNSPSGPTVYNTNQFCMNPYMALADTFLRAVSPEGFQLVSIQQDSISQRHFRASRAMPIKAGYINQWQTILTNLVRDVRILGYRPGKPWTELKSTPTSYHDKITKTAAGCQGQ